ncbi:MAG: phosphoribosylamine--glycine ligase [Cyclobacteriaceae bacterium]|nr:phosphoribosylamine--glycine ligase [Cyclobacteriaceae bacterium]
MNILLIGSGGREHALAWKMRQSSLCTQLYIAPGNAGTAIVGENLPVKADDLAGIIHACREKKIDLVVVGPEVPLVAGLRDHLERQPDLGHLLMVGPGQSGARLEGSKDFSKHFMERHNIPTAKARTFTEADLAEGLSYLDHCLLPIVLKADGLAAGKGVIICQTHEEAKSTLKDMLSNHLFGEASARVLVEEFLSGIELSVFVLTDGESYVLLPEAKDYKRIGEMDQGPNTGGMGAVSPVPFADVAFMEKVRSRIIVPTLKGLQAESIPYRGFIFFGLINVNGNPMVIEYNARMGDPETEAVIPRIKSDLVELLVACAKGNLKDSHIEISPETAVTVMMVSGGYPGDYAKGKLISGLSDAPGALLFHAGTRHAAAGILTDGGRVLAATGQGSRIDTARQAAYQALAAISFEQAYFRRDIGVDLLSVEKS